MAKNLLPTEKTMSTYKMNPQAPSYFPFDPKNLSNTTSMVEICPNIFVACYFYFLSTPRCQISLIKTLKCKRNT